jgi:methylmalonyl-CoA mutase cobalamin-binding subunit
MSTVILLGTVGSDVHSVANTLLEKALIDSGLNVHNLGVAVPEQEWIDAANRFSPDLVLIGSMNGDLIPLHSAIRSLINILPAKQILIGGKLNLGSDGLSNAPLIKAMGVGVIEDADVTFEEIISYCKMTIEANGKFGSQRIQDAR